MSKCENVCEHGHLWRPEVSDPLKLALQVTESPDMNAKNWILVLYESSTRSITSWAYRGTFLFSPYLPLWWPHLYILNLLGFLMSLFCKAIKVSKHATMLEQGIWSTLNLCPQAMIDHFHRSKCSSARARGPFHLLVKFLFLWLHLLQGKFPNMKELVFLISSSACWWLEHKEDFLLC